MKRLLLMVLIVLAMTLAAGPASAENGPKVGDGPSATSIWRM